MQAQCITIPDVNSVPDVNSASRLTSQKRTALFQKLRIASLERAQHLFTGMPIPKLLAQQDF